MTHGSLFNGIGGFQLAAEWMGWENVMSCEIDDFCNQVTKYHFPNCTQHYDIRETDFTIYKGGIDILTGGFPCQPFSVAGKQRGTEDERYLWDEMLRAIREIEPRWIVGENVYGLLNWSGGLVFEQVCSDLEAQGYEVQPVILPACGVNAPHRRDRIWFIAENTNQNGRISNIGQSKSDKRKFGDVSTGNNEPIRTNNEEIGLITNSTNTRTENMQFGGKDGIYEPEIASDTSSKGLERKMCRNSKLSSKYITNVTNTDSRRQSCKEHREKESRQFTKKSIPNNWENFPTQSPICNGDDGLSSRLDSITFPKWRNESIKGGGNAIAPAVAYQIFKSIE